MPTKGRWPMVTNRFEKAGITADRDTVIKLGQIGFIFGVLFDSLELVKRFGKGLDGRPL